TRQRIAQLFPADALEQTCRMLDACQFSLDDLRYEYPHEIVPAGHTSTSYRAQETWAGARRRYPAGVPATVRERLEFDL
ncbi:DNA polymerase III subunit alpha, partial [Burkholderia pseudomallei]